MPKEPPPYHATPDELRAIDEALAEPRPPRRTLANQPRRRLIFRPKLKMRPASTGAGPQGKDGAVSRDGELPDNGSGSATVPDADVPAFYRAITDRLRRDAVDPSKPDGMREQILKAARRFDELAAELPAATR
jgi:hypothetical protein